MNYPPIINQNSDGGVEEKKDDEPVTLSPDRHFPHTNGLHHQYSSGHFPSNGAPNDAEAAAEAMNNNNSSSSRNPHKQDGFQAHIQNFVRTIVESCESVVTFLVRGGEGGCPWPGNNNGGGMTPTNHRPAAVVNPPLSITEELRKLAESEGRVFGGGMRRADIPRFLGEEAVYSFDDDNISAISQHTLEEMTKHGIRQPVRRKLSSESSQSTSSLQPPPVPMKVELMHVHEEREGIV
jgi:hypothetical protein